MRVFGVVLLGMAVVFAPAWAMTVEQEAKLMAADGQPGDGFGLGIALSRDTAIIGTGLGHGPAYVFTRTGGVWTEQTQLRATDAEPGNFFAASVAIDGDTALIGAYGDNDNGWWSGAAYVFTREGSEWTEQAKLTASDGETGDYFSMSLAIDGDTAVVGMGQGEAAYVFTRTGADWTEQARLLASDGVAGDGLGWAVAVDGNTAVIGTSWGEAVYVFTRTGNVWTEQAKLTASDGGFGAYFGWSLEIDGDTAMIGAYGDDENGSWSGAVYVFTREEGVWTEQAKLTPADGVAGDYFGMSIALDGDTSVIGSSFFGGAAYAFTRAEGVWTEQATLLPIDGDPWDGFGWSVALDGDRALVGASTDNDNGDGSGSTYVFRLGPEDADGDGIGDDADICPDTAIPESVPTRSLGVNRWALVDDDDSFDTSPPPGGGNGPGFAFTLADTAGCSCEQIIEAMALGWGQTKFGCSTGVMSQWIGSVGGYPESGQN